MSGEHGPHWVVVVPVKGTDASKSRLDVGAARPELAHAFALDALTAVLGSSLVDEVVVVVARDASLDDLRTLGVRVVLEEEGGGLNGAVRTGVAVARQRKPHAGVAVLLGDLPGLTTAEFDRALVQAAAYPLSVVPDAEGTGTTLLLARPGAELEPRFGAGSFARHRDGGHRPLDVPEDSGLRRDVDTAADLQRALALGVGGYTLAAWSSAAPARAAVDAGSRIQRGTAEEETPAASSGGTAAASVSSTSQASSTPPVAREP
ncbi:2-phospho-L-lactate guanylyltransferase [Compostimonas suwonensis]|uniref:Phosphoenolpyruvate guanylyltransferase n=1 Tax=Compostimonas suwonensis TaxID=1048394 RepID=A0A2M9C019_9MICO|nr:2-phospho-L-lactate guanylyltransferase [Compostimonas suwonensis]